MVYGTSAWMDETSPSEKRPFTPPAGECHQMGVEPKIGVGPPNHPFLIGFSIVNHPFRGYPYFWFNIQMKLESPKEKANFNLPGDSK